MHIDYREVWRAAKRDEEGGEVLVEKIMADDIMRKQMKVRRKRVVLKAALVILITKCNNHCLLHLSMREVGVAVAFVHDIFGGGSDTVGHSACGSDVEKVWAVGMKGEDIGSGDGEMLAGGGAIGGGLRDEVGDNLGVEDGVVRSGST